MLNDHTLARFQPLAGDLVRPQHDYSFGAIAPTIEAMFGLTPKAPILPLDVFGGHLPKPRRVVLLFIDSFGFEFWQRYASQSRLMTQVMSEGILTPISALFPSTTSGSVSTLALGVPPSTHGLHEWLAYVPAIGETIQTLPFLTLQDEPRSCAALGHDVHALWTTHETIHTRLRRAGVRSVQLAHADYAMSRTNAVISAGADVLVHTTFDQALEHFIEHVSSRPQQRELISFYWAGLDSIAHACGPDSAEFADATSMVWSAFDTALNNLHRSDTVILITADHGHVGARAKDTLYINHRWPDLRDRLAIDPHSGAIIWPNGSPRDMFIHLKPDWRAETLALLRDGLSDQATVIAVDDAVSGGLFGTPDVHPELRRRLGDVLILPHGKRFIWWAEPGVMANPFHGHHGGLSREEMTTVLGVLSG